MSKLFFTELIGWIATFFGFVFIWFVIQLISDLVNKRQESKNIPYLLYIVSALNCCFGFYYCMNANLASATFINFAYGSTCLICFVIFCIHINDYEIKNSIIIILVAIISTYALNYYLYYYVAGSTCGLINMVGTTIMWVTPSQKIKEMFDSGDHNIIQIKITGMSGLITFSWFLYGMLNDFDLIIVIPNFIGLVINLVTFYFWRDLYIKNTANLIEDIRKSFII